MLTSVNTSNASRNNGNGSTEYKPTVFSHYSFANPEATIDSSALRIQHWNGLLKIAIAPKIPGSTSDYDNKNAIALHLSVPRAYILLKEIEHFQTEGTDAFYGIETPKGLIGISDGSEFGHPGIPCLVIRRMEGGQTINTYAYEFKRGFYHGIRNFNEKDQTFDRKDDIYDDTEIELLKNQIKEYLNAMSMSMAYSVVEATSYNESQTYKSLNQIKEALNIEVKRRGGTGTGNFFNGGASKAPKNSYDSLNQAVGGHDDMTDLDGQL